MFALWPLGNPVYEKRSVAAPEQDDRPISFRLSLPGSGDPLLDYLTAKVRVDLAAPGAGHSISQDRIVNAFLSGKTPEPTGFEDSHEISIPFYSIALGTREARPLIEELRHLEDTLLGILLPLAIARRVLLEDRIKPQPGTVRFGFAPLYTRHIDVHDAIAVIDDVMTNRAWDTPAFKARKTVT